MSTAPDTGLSTRPSQAMRLLERGIPLSLLLDLAYGPRSEELLRDELPTQRTGD